MNTEPTYDEAAMARQALQESMDLRDQGHSED
ncbi:3-isopropylmalate dehydrogenase [Phycicoccus flavus]|nr:3-isopropylmalate dehydrogenase [Phycicoccus flavus]NHA68198.1 3-isopropylmalate dehydrogenase [Phycicoccus flavus]